MTAGTPIPRRSLGALLGVPFASAAIAADAWQALRTAGHFALIRHASAPGVYDPPGFRLDDCTTQRNLSADGRAQAIRIGDLCRANGIAAARLYSSQWCRCVDTAKLLGLGTVETEPTFGNVVVLRDQREALTVGARAHIAGWTGRGNLLVVTHGANIFALTGVSPASGEIVVVKGGSDRAAPVGRLLLD